MENNTNEFLNIEQQFGSRIKALFNDATVKDKSPFDRGFAFPGIIEKDAVLFLGINPSYNKKNGENLNPFYSVGQSIEKGYFKRFSEAGRFCGATWTHLDLLGIRETNQKTVEALQGDYLGFICDHLDLSKEILEESRPKVLVVCNTMARRYLGKDRFGDHNIWMGYEFGDMQEDGAYRIQNKDSKLKGVPVFFSGMLTGQRALDNGSFERLQWHIKKVLAEC